jgi:hypothetical protein
MFSYYSIEGQLPQILLQWCIIWFANKKFRKSPDLCPGPRPLFSLFQGLALFPLQARFPFLHVVLLEAVVVVLNKPEMEVWVDKMLEEEGQVKVVPPFHRLLAAMGHCQYLSHTHVWDARFWLIE